MLPNSEQHDNRGKKLEIGERERKRSNKNAIRLFLSSPIIELFRIEIWSSEGFYLTSIKSTAITSYGKERERRIKSSELYLNWSTLGNLRIRNVLPKMQYRFSVQRASDEGSARDSVGSRIWRKIESDGIRLGALLN